MARVPLPDSRFDFLVKHHQPLSVVPACLTVIYMSLGETKKQVSSFFFSQIMDIAGLVKGASEGRGLGNEFLSHISEVDAIFHVTRAFKDDEIEHVEGI